ncbi:hypothetical protein BT63DRAFT_470290 [Microthyrium microscopicum]|uniref:F-box domain-containing protein n=1 Tax=Microthyrium microscopicum TaxID=703497 RepID=A0A6A6UGP5_9PEZI|nr:hypothetical protein BT63DRAFT_470290 [Microthyrium microscopicum]
MAERRDATLISVTIRLVLVIPLIVLTGVTVDLWNNFRHNTNLKSASHYAQLGKWLELSAVFAPMAFVWTLLTAFPAAAVVGLPAFTFAVIDAALAAGLIYPRIRIASFLPMSGCKAHDLKTYGALPGEKGFFVHVAQAAKHSNPDSNPLEACKDYIWMVIQGHVMAGFLLVTATEPLCSEYLYRLRRALLFCSFSRVAMGADITALWWIFDVLFRGLWAYTLTDFGGIFSPTRLPSIYLDHISIFSQRRPSLWRSLNRKTAESKEKLLQRQLKRRFQPTAIENTMTETKLGIYLSYDILVQVTRNLDYCDIVNLSLTSKHLWHIIFLNERNFRQLSLHWQRYTCNAPTRTRCPHCAITMCADCEVRETRYYSMIMVDDHTLCKLYCVSCFNTQANTTYKTRYRCQCTKRPIANCCKFCEILGAEKLTDRWNRKHETDICERDQVESRRAVCHGCKAAVGGFVRFWICTRCGKECRHGMHPGWGRKGEAQEDVETSGAGQMEEVMRLGGMNGMFARIL